MMMMMISIISLLLVSLLCVLSSHDTQKVDQNDNIFDWSYCSNYTGHYVKINYIDVLSPPHTKLNRTAIMNINIYETISYGTIHFIVKYNFHDTLNVTLIDEYLNLCDMWVDLTHEYCPIKPGNYNLHKSVTLPPVFPKGHYYGKIVTFDEKGQDLVCIRFLLDTKDIP